MSTPWVSQFPRLFADSPLRHAAFRLFYAGSIGSAVGYTMQATVAAWLMATLTPSAFMVALVQTASTGPAMLFGLFAGALADIIDRRRIILITQVVLVAAAALLGVATLAGVIGPSTLLFLTFIIGAGFAFYQPAQQASINELVSRAELPRAVALGAVAFNMARAVGPALAGAIAAWLSTGSALLVASVFFAPMIWSALRWEGRTAMLPGIPETVIAGVRSGLRFARHSVAMRSFIIRNLTFAACASAFWALLPVIARDQLGLGAGGFGLLSAAFGAGAIFGALIIPHYLQQLALNAIVKSGVMLWTVAVVLIAVTHFTLLALLGAFACGMAWVAVFVSLSAGTQSAAPAWVRARAVGMNMVSAQASLALGSALWGAVASGVGTQIALGISAFAQITLYYLYRRVRVEMGSEKDVTPSLHLPELPIKLKPLPDDGPVLIQIEYHIAQENRADFLRALRKVERARRRNGAASWRVYRDIGVEGRFVERFVLDSWSEYERLRTRSTISDREIYDRVEALQRSDQPIKVSRLLGIGDRDLG